MTISDTARTILKEKQDLLADKVIETLWENHPEYDRIFSIEGKEKCRQDIKYHILYLAEAVGVESQQLFNNYLGWVKVLFASLRIPEESFIESLKTLRSTVSGAVEGEEEHCITAYLDQGMAEFPTMPSTDGTVLGPDNPLHKPATLYLSALLEGEREAASTIIFEQIESGIHIKDIYLSIFQAVQREIGRLWQMNRISVAQEHYCTAATQLIMSRLYPYVFSRKKTGGTFIGACVGDELHEMGVRMITDFFEMDGWDTYFLGANTPLEAFLSSLKDYDADLVGIGATITYHIDAVRRIIEAIRGDPKTKEVKILVGGYPFNLDNTLWKRVGADAFAENAQEAVSIGNQLLRGAAS